MSVLVTVGALVLIALWAMASYRKLVGLRTAVTKGWRQLDAQLKRRHDLVLDLVNAVQNAAEVESVTLEAVVAARNRAISVSGPTNAGRKEAELSKALADFLGASQSEWPLAADRAVRALQEDLTGAENRIDVARQSYNKVAATYNAATDAIPGNIVAGFAGFRPAELFQATNQSR
jgi:LemA protein